MIQTFVNKGEPLLQSIEVVSIEREWIESGDPDRLTSSGPIYRYTRADLNDTDPW